MEGLAQRTRGPILGEEDGCLELILSTEDIFIPHIVGHVAHLVHYCPRLRSGNLIYCGNMS